MFSLPPPSSSLLKVPNLHPTPLSQRLKQVMLPPPLGPETFVTYVLPSFYSTVVHVSATLITDQLPVICNIKVVICCSMDVEYLEGMNGNI